MNLKNLASLTDFLKLCLVFSVFTVSSCDFFSSEEQSDVNEFGLYDDPVVLYGKQLDDYLELDRTKTVDKSKVFGVWYGGLLSKRSDGFSNYAYFQVTPDKFISILVCLKEEPYTVGFSKAVSTLDFEGDSVNIGAGTPERGLFFGEDGKDYICEISPVPEQKYIIDIKDSKLGLYDRLNDFEFMMNRYY